MRIIIASIGIVAVAASSGITSGYAQDGKNPPGVNPAHYQCYKVEAPTNPITVKVLRDQFGTAGPVQVTTPLYLCAPTEKNGQALKDKTTHYLCYQDDGVKPANKKVNIVNQFTKKTGINLAVHGPAFLCVPSRKKVLG